MIDRHKLRKDRGDYCHYCNCLTNFKTTANKDSATVEHLIHAGIAPGLKRVNDRSQMVIACYACNTEQNKKFVVANPLKKLELDLVGMRKALAKAQSAEKWDKAKELENGLVGMERKWNKLAAQGVAA